MIEINYIDENTVELNGALQVTDRGGKLSVKLLTTPTSKWVDNAGKKLNTSAGMTLPTRAVDPYEGVFESQDSITNDPHRYKTSWRRYTVKDSTLRAVNKVYDETWEDFQFSKGDKRDLAKIVVKLIRDAYGRNEIYRLGGRAVNVKNTGAFDRYNLVEIFQWVALMDGVISEPVLG